VSGPATRIRTPRAVWVVAAVLGVLIVAGLAAWPLGGWDTVTPASARIPVLATDQRHEGTQVAVRIEKATVGPAGPDGSAPFGGGDVLTVTAVVEDLDDEPASSAGLGDTLVITGLRLRAGDPDVRVAADTTRVGDLGPGVPTRLTFSWQVPTGSREVGSRVEVEVVDRTPVASVLSVGTRWIDPRVAAVWRGELGRGPEVRDDGLFGLGS